jgi:hypothetical protein
MTIKTLTVSILQTSLNKDENTSITVMATYTDGTSKDMTEQVEWVMTPKDVVKVTEKTLIAKKDVQTKIKAKIGTVESNVVGMTITWVVNGHTLPPEPDPKINNATLLGIDVNDNGVRDDVERYIIIEEAKNPNFPKTQTAISLQYARAWQKMIETPTIEVREYIEEASACQEYFINKYTKGMGFQDYLKWQKEHSSRLGVELEDKIFNTRERIMERFKFNEACSGHIFNGRKIELDACQTNIDVLVE